MDDRTPLIKSLCFQDIEAENCHVAAAYMYGLPEQRIERVEMDHVRVTYAASAREGQPAMMDGCSSHICRMGIYANQIEELILTDVKVEGQDGPAIITENIGRVCGSI